MDEESCTLIPNDIKKRIAFSIDSYDTDIEEFIFLNNNIIFCGLDCTLDLAFNSYHIDHFKWSGHEYWSDNRKKDISVTAGGYQYGDCIFDKSGRLLSTEHYNLTYFDNSFMVKSVSSKSRNINITIGKEGEILDYIFDVQDDVHINCHYILIGGNKRLVLCNGIFINYFESFIYNEDGSLRASLFKSAITTRRIKLNKVIYK